MKIQGVVGVRPHHWMLQNATGQVTMDEPHAKGGKIISTYTLIKLNVIFLPINENIINTASYMTKKVRRGEGTRE